MGLYTSILAQERNNTMQNNENNNKDNEMVNDLMSSGALTAKKHSHGFSYVVIFKVINIIISIIAGLALIIVGGLSAGYITTFQWIFIILGLIIPFPLYWILTFPIKMFENVAIIAKNSTEILNQMNNTK